ncbi:MAG: DUF4402 domain-containing protein [Mariniphaga sp.]
MKRNFRLILLLVTFLFGFVGSSFAQVSASSTSSATIIIPINITKTVDMNFGNVAVNAVAGTVILAPAGGRTITGGVTLPAVTGTVAAAAFTVTGAPTYTFSISLPSSPLTITSGANTMTVTAFTSTPSITGTLAAGTASLLVGATLNVGINQVAGTYTSATPFSVTVNYN